MDSHDCLCFLKKKKTANVEGLFCIQSWKRHSTISPKIYVADNKEKEPVEIHDHLPPERRWYFKIK